MIKGMGELHLEIIVDRMKREFKVDANVGAPQVAYRETITRNSEVDYTHKKQTGGAGQFARVKLRFEPLPPGSGFVFENAVTELDDEELDRMIEALRERALSARQEQTLELKPEPKALPNGRH